MAEHNARLNKLVANFGDIEARRKLIAEFGNSDSAFIYKSTENPIRRNNNIPCYVVGWG